MDTIYNLFKNDIVELEKYIIYTEENIRDNKDDHYLQSVYKKKIDYKIVIISLYGYLELYMTSLVKQYLESLENNIFSYKFYSQKIKEKHVTNSILLSGKILEKKGAKYENINLEFVIDNLNECLKDNNYSFNKDAFILNTGNLKHNKICDMFNGLDINLHNILEQHEEFKSQSSENKFFIIDELVDRRNEISHGDTDNLLNLSVLKDYISFIDKYIRVIKNILKIELNKKILDYKLQNSLLLENVKVFPSKILGVFNKKIRINKAKHFILIKTEEDIYLSKILEKKKHEDGVSLKLEKNLRENFKYYLFNKELYKNKSLKFY